MRVGRNEDVSVGYPQWANMLNGSWAKGTGCPARLDVRKGFVRCCDGESTILWVTSKNVPPEYVSLSLIS